MHNDSRRLLSAVSKAVGRDLNVSEFEDRLTLQKGCYILNSWGFGPMYKFSLYIRGPYSSDLADDYYEVGTVEAGCTDVPVEAIRELSNIFADGIRYAEAYSTVLLIKNNSPGASYSSIENRALELKPYLEAEVKRAAECLLK